MPPMMEESVLWKMENYGISKMCFFCSGNLEYGFNFPEGLLSQLRLKLAIGKDHISLTDPSLQSEGGAEAATSGWSPERSHQAPV